MTSLQQVGMSKLDTRGGSISSTKIAEFILNSLLDKFTKHANETISTFAQDIFEPKTENVTTIIHSGLISQEESSEILKTEPHDIVFEQIVSTLVHVSKHDLEVIIECIFDWRSNFDINCPETMKKKIAEVLPKKKGNTKKDTQLQQLYSERAEAAADYIYLYLTELILSNAPHHVDIGNSLSDKIEDICFEFFNKLLKISGIIPDYKKVMRNKYAEILGVLSGKRFQEITEKFFHIVDKTTKDVTHLVYGLKHLNVQLDSTVNVAKSVKFMKEVYNILTTSKKSELKIAMYEVVSNMMSSLAGTQYTKTVDYKEWNDQVLAFLKLTKVKIKQKYQLASYSFFSTFLCLSYEIAYLEYFQILTENLFKLLNVRERKTTRLTALDCLLHIFGYYLKISEITEDIKLKEAVNEKLNKLSSHIFSLGKRTFPSVSNVDQYDSIVDIILMISEVKLDFALLSMIMECFKTDNYVSENVLIGLRAFMAIAEKSDMEKIYPLIEEEKKYIKYPSWMLKLIQKSEPKRAMGTIRESEEVDSSIRVNSPFSNMNTISSNMNSIGTGTLSKNSVRSSFVKQKFHQINVGIRTFEDELAKLFTVVLKELDKQYGSYTLVHTSKSINETFKDKLFGLNVYATAISCISQLLPSGYSASELMEMLCRCVIHQHREVRDISWQVLLHLLEFHPQFRVLILHSFIDLTLTINDFKYTLLEAVLIRLIALLNKWIEICKKKKYKKDDFYTPAVYGKLQTYTECFDIVRFESAALILLCNINPDIRVFALSIIASVDKLTEELVELGELENKAATLQDVLNETSTALVKKFETSNHRRKTQIKFTNLSELISGMKGDYHLFLREFASITSDLCSVSSRNAIEKLSRKYASLTVIDSQTKLPIFNDNDSLEFWKNLSIFSCSVVFGDEVSLSINPTKAFVIRHPRELYDSILPHLKSSNELQISYAVFAIGSVNEACLETLFELMNEYELEAYGDKKRKPSRKRDILRIQIARIYSRIADNVSDTIFRDKEFIKDKFLNFISEQLNFLKNPTQLYALDFQMLRWNFFIILTKISQKFFYYPPKDGLKTLDISLKKELIQYVIQWTGFGEESKKREQTESFNLDQAVKQIKIDEEKIQFEHTFKRHSERITEAAIDALCSLLHGMFLGSQPKEIKQWSMQNRIKLKSMEHEKATMDKTLNVVRNSETQKNQRNNSATITLGGFFKGGILETIRKDNTSTSPMKEDENDNLGITLFQWIDDALLSQNSTTVDLVIQGISNLLEGNHDILELLIDQCYSCNEDISNGYFYAIVNVFSKMSVKCTPPIMLSLILYKARASSKNVRDLSFKLLNIMCQRYFDEMKTDNYSYFVSSNFLDSYGDIQYSLSKKLSKDFPNLSILILQEWFIRLSYVLESDQRAMLLCLRSWIRNIHLSQRLKISLPTGQYDAKDIVLSCLYDITYTYGDTFPAECQLLWKELAIDANNIDFGLNFIITRCTRYENSLSILQVSQRIVRSLSLVSPKECVDVMIKEFISYRDNKRQMNSMEAFYGNPSHGNSSSSNLDQVTSNRSSYVEDRLELFTATETVLCLLVGVAYHQKDALSEYLPLILQTLIIHLDHRHTIIIENAQLLLINLIHRFVINELPHVNATVSEAQHLQDSQMVIKFITENPVLWQNDLSQPKISSINNVTKLVTGLLKVFRNEKNFIVRWGEESLKWTTNSKKFHPVIRSFQIFKTIKPPLRRQTLLELTKNLKYYLNIISSYKKNSSNGIPTPPVEFTPRNLGLGSFSRVHTEYCAKERSILNEIISTLREIVVSLNSKNIILFPQIFWISVSMLNYEFILLYTNAISLFIDLLGKFDMNSTSVQNVLSSSIPLKNISNFQGIQKLLIRGLFNYNSEPLAVHALSTISLINCDLLFNNTGSCSVMNIISLLPYLCLHISDKSQQTSFKIASNLALACASNKESTVFGSKLKKVGKVFLRYSKGIYSNCEKFLLDLRKPICEAFLPKFEIEIFDLLEKFLEIGLKSYKSVALSIIHSFALYIDSFQSKVYHRDQFNLIETLTKLLAGPLWQEAGKVLDVIIKTCAKGSKIKLNNNREQNEKKLKTWKLEFGDDEYNVTNILELLDQIIESNSIFQNVDILNILSNDQSIKTLKGDIKVILEIDGNIDESSEDSNELSEATDGDFTYRFNVDEKEENLVKLFDEQILKQMSNLTLKSPYPKKM